LVKLLHYLNKEVEAMYDALRMRHLAGKIVFLKIAEGRFELREHAPSKNLGNRHIFLVKYVGTDGITVSPVYKSREAGHVHDRFILFNHIT